MLRLSHVSVLRGRTFVVKDVSLSVGSGEVIALVGANGAGKTTLAAAIAGLVKVVEGEMIYEASGSSIHLNRLSAAERYRGGIILVPAERPVFEGLSVHENLRLVCAILKSPRKIAAALVDDAYDVFALLRKKRHQLAGTLSGGEKRMLALGRAWLAHLILLARGNGNTTFIIDEPTHGLAPLILHDIATLIERLSVSSAGIIIIEQNIAFAKSVAKRGYIMNAGEVVQAGPSNLWN